LDSCFLFEILYQSNNKPPIRTRTTSINITIYPRLRRYSSSNLHHLSYPQKTAMPTSNALHEHAISVKNPNLVDFKIRDTSARETKRICGGPTNEI